MVTVDNLSFSLMLFTAVGSALSAGIFFAFSSFVIKALAEQLSSQGITTMQSIKSIRGLFMLVFLGPAAVCIVLNIFLLLQWHQSVTVYWLAGSLLYLVGTIGVTADQRFVVE